MWIKSLLMEAALLLMVTAALGLSANALYSRGGIQIGKDYFNPGRGESGPRPPGPTTRPAAPDPAKTGERPPAEKPRRLEHGLQSVSPEEAYRYFTEMDSSGGPVVFVDARKPEEYEEGHIPGAVNVYHFQQDVYLPPVLDSLRAAQVIAVYCGGGDCEDSIHLGNDLIYKHQLPYKNVFLYEGGMQEWLSRGWPVREGGQP